MRYPLATATEVKLCPHCEEQLPSPRPAVCPSCGRAMPLGKSHAAQFFDCPDYLYFQKEVLSRPTDRKAKEGEEASHAKTLLAVHDDLTMFLRQSSPETLVAALFDAHAVLSHVAHSNIDGQNLRKIVVTAKAIGRLGESLDQYIRAGGTLHNDEKTGEARPLLSAPESDNWGATATADSRRGS
jgi:hypothetical protein